MSVELVIPADLLSLRSIEPWLQDVLPTYLAADRAGELLPRVSLALQELCVNAMEHGGLRPDDTISIWICFHANELHIEILDRGAAYDPTSIPEPDPLVPQVRGYGMLIVRKLATRFAVWRSGDENRTLLTIPVDEFEPEEEHTMSDNDTIPDTVIIEITGRFDVVAAPDVRRRLTETLDRGEVNIVVDMRDVVFVDSSGLAALVQGMKRAREHGGDVELVAPRDRDAMRVFELTKFDSIFRMRQA